MVGSKLSPNILADLSGKFDTGFLANACTQEGDVLARRNKDAADGLFFGDDVYVNAPNPPLHCCPFTAI
jgi:hypothetical protein